MWRIWNLISLIYKGEIIVWILSVVDFVDILPINNLSGYFLKVYYYPVIHFSTYYSKVLHCFLHVAATVLSIEGWLINRFSLLMAHSLGDDRNELNYKYKSKIIM